MGYDQPEQINIGTNPAAVLWRKVMQPIHEGLPKEALYDGNAFTTVAVCLDSGKLATDACKSDVRQFDRVVYANVYPEDVPTETCDKHVMVDFCAIGGGVATEYCSQYPENGIYRASLVKLTPEEVQEIRSASRVGLLDQYLDSGGIYLDGGGVWRGFNNDRSNPNGTPYLECMVHQSPPGNMDTGNTQAPDSYDDSGFYNPDNYDG